MLKKSFSLLLKVLGGLIGISFLVITIHYITCPVYVFRNSQPFSGDQLYNPYNITEAAHWRKGNFQIQSNVWGGLTAGRKNSNEKIWDLYGRMGYDIIGISDYQKINRYGEGRPGYVPIYEHGYNIRKVHQVVIGADEVVWHDFPIYQNRHHKQRVIEELGEGGGLIFLAHPLLRKGYSFDDMAVLGGYDGIEVMTHSWTSIEHWDAALSAGNYVTILADDDAHDINNLDEVGQTCTFINSPTLEEADILRAFKEGRTYGVRIWRQAGETLEEKIKRSRRLPMLTRHDLAGDTLRVASDSLARFIRFIGQGGEGLQTDYETHETSYVFRAEDTYIRAEIHFNSGTILYMNPVCRCDGDGPSKIPPAEVDTFKTWLQRIIGLSLLLGALGVALMTFRSLRNRGRAGT